MQKIAIILLSAALIACGQTEAPPSLIGPPEQTGDSKPIIMCAQDAMQCPDGSFVGRSGPQCEFICPQESSKK